MPLQVLRVSNESGGGGYFNVAGINRSLELNKNNNKFEAARHKILLHHFLDGDVQEFIEMETPVLPRAVAWAGRDMNGHSLLYQILRCIPSLFGSSEKNNSVILKRKRGMM